MSQGIKIPISLMEPIAEKVKTSLLPYCEQVEIAGSIRRRKQLVGDVELVVIPKKVLVKEATADQPSLFGDVRKGEPAIYNNLLWSHLDHLVDTSKIIQGHAWGELYRRFNFRTVINRLVVVDVFTAAPQNWGNTLWMRTGSRKFNLHIVQHIRQQGMGHRDGWLISADGEILESFTEADFFNQINHPYIEPIMRNAVNAKT